MDRHLMEAPREEPGADESTPGRKGIVLAVVGALLIALAMLDGWPVA